MTAEMEQMKEKNVKINMLHVPALNSHVRISNVSERRTDAMEKMTVVIILTNLIVLVSIHFRKVK